MPDGEGVARDVTRDPVPVGDGLDILRTHPKLLLNGLVAENPHYLSPDDHIAARLGRNERRRGLGDVDRRIAVQAATSSRTPSLPPRPPLPSPPSGQVPPRDPTLPPQRPGTRARPTGPGRHLARCRDVPQPAFRRGRLGPLRAHDGITAAGTSSDHQQWRRLAREHHRRGRAVGLGVGRGGLKPSGSCPASPDA